MITGESRPVRRGEGDTVVAGTVATDSGLRVEITAVGDDTALAGIQRLVTEAQNSSSRAQRIADRAAALAVLVRAGRRRHHRRRLDRPRACPTRPSSAPSPCWSSPAPTPSAWRSRWWSPSPPNAPPAAAYWSRTGSPWSRCAPSTPCCSTRPAPSPRASRPSPPSTPPAVDAEDEVLALAASAETDSEHPLARAIVAAAEHRGLRLTRPATSPRRRPSGVTATVDGQPGAGRRTAPAAASTRQPSCRSPTRGAPTGRSSCTSSSTAGSSAP